MTDQEPIAAEILAALNAVDGLTAFDRDEVPGSHGVPGTPPDNHVLIDLSRRPTDVRRFGGYMKPLHELNVTYRAKNVTSCRYLRRLVTEALEDQSFGDHGALAFNDETQAIDDDPDWGWSGIDTWRFC